MNNSISVVLSTCNRCQNLKDVIHSLLQQETHGNFDFEIIVVDNNSSDQTKEIAGSLQKKAGGRLRYTFEPNQGVSYARNHGLREARGRLIAFTDDDLIIDKKWLSSIWRCFEETDFDAMGGRVLPLYPDNPPEWVVKHKDILSGPIVAHDFGKDTKLYDEKMVPFIGACMVFKKKVMEECGGFLTEIGPGKGTMGEDTDVFLRLKKINKKIYYCGQALAWHKVEKERMNLRYIAWWHMLLGRYMAHIDIKEEKKDVKLVFGVPRYAIRVVLKDILFLAFSLFDQTAFLKTWMKIFYYIGVMQGYRKYSSEEEVS